METEEPIHSELRRYVDHLVTFNARLSPNGILTMVNKTAADAVGLEQVDLIDHHFSETFWFSYDIDVRERLRAAISEAAGGKTVSYKEKIRVKDGFIMAQLSLRPVFGEQEKVEYIVAEAQDVTELVEAQKEMRNAYELLNSMSNFAGIADTDGRMRFVNMKALEMLGFKTDEVVGVPFWECGWFVSLPDVQDTVRRSIDRARRGETARMEIRACTKDGIELPVFFTCAPMLSGKNGISAIALEGVVITELKEKEKTIRRERRAFQLIADAAVNAENVQALCRMVLFGLCETLDFARGSLRLYDAKTNTLIPVAVFGEDKEDEKKIVPHSLDDRRHVVSVMAQSREPIFAPDIRDHPIYQTHKEALDNWEVRAFISWPIMGKDERLLGTLQLIGTSPREILHQDRVLFETVAGMFATALEREQMEERIRSSLDEKVVLLKEIHHRVKNNLQVISSLLNLQSRDVEAKDYLELVRASQNRIRSMALVHERLYRSEDLSSIGFDQYLKDLVNNLFVSYSVSAGKIELNMDVRNVLLGIDMAIPCGLIVNELVSNSLKYAFPDDARGEMYIRLCEEADGRYLLVVRDNGIGLPDGFDFQHTKSLGMQLVMMLTQQMDGSIELDGKNGTAFKIRFGVRRN